VAPDETVSSAVVRAIATVKGVDPVDLDERLYDHIEPDALDTLLESKSGDSETEIQVSFSMSGCDIDVFDAGKIVVAPTSSPTTISDRPR
jgi:hypothetical protein